MIILSLLNVIYLLFSLLTTPINVPSLPSDAENVAMQIGEYIGMGWNILDAYANMNYLLTLFSIILAIDVAIALYKFVMWVIRKIPMANIS